MPRGKRDLSKPVGKSRGGKRPHPDPNEIAFSVFQRSIGEAPLLPEDVQKHKGKQPVTMEKAGRKFK